VTRIDKWPAIRDALRRLRTEIGYITLQTYFPDRPGTQIGRIDMTERMIRHWLDYRSVDETDEHAVETALADLSEHPKQYPVDDFALGLEDDTGIVEDAAAAAKALAALGEAAPDDEDDEDGEEEDDLEAAAAKEAAKEAEEARARFSSDQVEGAIKGWMLSTCENNTDAGAVAQFRVRFYQPKGAQCFSVVFRYRSAAAPLHPQPTLAPQSVPTAVSAPPPPPPRAVATAMQTATRTDGDVLDRMKELFAMPSDFDPFTQNPAAPSNGTPADTPSNGTPSNGARSGPQRYEVETLLHLHGLYRAYGATSLGMMREVKEVYGTVLAQIKDLYGGVLTEVGEALKDARTHNDDLLAMVQQIRLTELEEAIEFATASDNNSVKTQLGREAIQQLGLVGRLMLARKGVKDPDKTLTALDAPAEGPDTPVDDAVSERETAPGLDASATEDLEDWLVSRPDVMKTLCDPHVRAYLKDKSNVNNLAQLAKMMADPTDVDEEAAETARTETKTTPETPPADDADDAETPADPADPKE